MAKKRIKHKHRWSKQYRGIFNGPIRVCENGRCGAVRMASGHIVVLRKLKGLAAGGNAHMTTWAAKDAENKEKA